MPSLHDETLAFMQQIGLTPGGAADGKESGAKKAAKQPKDGKQQPAVKAPRQESKPQPKAQQEAPNAQRKRKLEPPQHKAQQQQQKQQQQQRAPAPKPAATAAAAAATEGKKGLHLKFTDGEVDLERTEREKQQQRQQQQQQQRQQQQQQQHQKFAGRGTNTAHSAHAAAHARELAFGQADGGKKWYSIRAGPKEAVEGDDTMSKKEKKKQQARKHVAHKQLNYAQMETVRQSAEEQWTAEAAAYAAQKRQNQSADDKWVHDVIQSGTLSDKIAALTLLVQQSPIHNSQLLDNLVGMATKKERRVMEMATKALKDLLINDLLPDRRLVRFEQRLQEAGTDELSPREAILYIFEDHLKLKYGELLRALEEGMKDTVEAHRRFCLDVCFDLLASKPEKEDVLLKLIVNKLGDPMKKIAARALELLTKLTRRHGAMVEAIVEEVQQFLQRPNLGARATFNAIIFLSSIRFTQSAQGARAAEKVIGIYFTLFEQNVEDEENKAKIIAALLTGVNRAFPFLKNPSEAFKEKLETLFRIVHASSFNTAVQALGLIFQLVTVSKQEKEEQATLRNRFYRALYSILLSKEVLSRSRNTVFLNLIYRALKYDPAPNRVLAFCKRLCATALQAPSPIAAACMRLLSVALSAQPTVKSCIVAPQKFEQPEQQDDKEDDDENGAEEAAAVAADGADKVEEQTYDPLKREPLYAVHGNPGAWEGLLFRSHFHPSVSKMAESFFNGEEVAYDGDPMLDFSLRTFLDKFTYKNPKQGHAKHARKPTEQAPVNSESFVHKHVQEISPDAIFFHKYFNDLQKMQQQGLTRKKKKKVSQDDDDAEERALYGEDDEEAEMDRFADELAEGLMRDTAAGSGMPYDDDDDDFSDFSAPEDGDAADAGEDEDFDAPAGGDSGDSDDAAGDEEFDEAGMGGDDSDEDDDEDGDEDDEYDDVDAFGDFEEMPAKKAKSKASKNEPVFASADDYEDLARNIYEKIAAGEEGGEDAAESAADASSSKSAKRKSAQKPAKRAKLRRS